MELPVDYVDTYYDTEKSNGDDTDDEKETGCDEIAVDHDS